VCLTAREAGRVMGSLKPRKVAYYVRRACCYDNNLKKNGALTMASASPARDDRIKLRATREERRLIAEPAAHEQLDITRFVMRSVLPVARDVVRQSERIVLRQRDWKGVLELLEKPPKLTDGLITPGGVSRKREHSDCLARRGDQTTP
jgi:uncharacterized protein (DUF1778 family)